MTVTEANLLAMMIVLAKMMPKHYRKEVTKMKMMKQMWNNPPAQLFRDLLLQLHRGFTSQYRKF